MPGIVSQATASTVLPPGLASAYTECPAWPVLGNGPLPDGSRLTRVQGAADRLEWKLARRPTGAAYDTLLAFWVARKGAHQTFYFYPVLAQYDATGVSTTGRYLVRFLGAFRHERLSGIDGARFDLVQCQ